MDTNQIDIGVVIDGIVTKDSNGELCIINDDGESFPVEKHLKQFEGKQIRFTCISLESMEKMEETLKSIQG
jgi:hypothetical protein